MTKPRLPQRGLYLLADESALPFHLWAETLPACLDAGVKLVQYRAKQQPPQIQAEHASYLLSLCQQRHIPLLINDDVDLCLHIGADGAHLGRSDGELQKARQQLGPDMLLGNSCYNQLQIAQQAVQAGADYVSFGRLFSSSTKPEASGASLDVITQASSRLEVPICAIGGITPQNASQVIAAGADLLCVAGAILASKNPASACRKLATIAR